MIVTSTHIYNYFLIKGQKVLVNVAVIIVTLQMSTIRDNHLEAAIIEAFSPP